ncbi:zinc-dependent metalloprotease [Kocuria palustris]|uniref:zinc-dependent metalloprotease n=1 Tax=Kocuria palustris TaxID=71999 RepID=UPI0006AA5AC7|nr:zinc-dependent metalloprotease [Kocuria palustris]ALB02508.1 hydrolase [Kocuria palustris]MCT1835276.1 zinc-dependent metalloprotease [Kocuria palustris]
MSTSESSSSTQRSGLIHWPSAARIAARTAPPGPTPEPEQLRTAVASIRGHAEASVDHVHAISGLAAARGLVDAPVVVVDRAGWSRANTATFELLLEPALSELRRARADRLDRGMNAELIQSVAARAAAAEAGGLMAYLSTKVLGQYDPYAGMVSEDAARRFPGGRLMVVAPNVLQIERELNVDPDDFRLWVCLHEQTHRVQFAAAPWLREQMIRDMRELTVSLSGDADAFGRRLSAVGSSAGAAVKRMRRGRGQEAQDPDSLLGPLSAALDEREREMLERTTAVMSLLEGHANWVMDGVDSSIVSSVKTIRRRFERRADLRGPLDRAVRRLLGLEAKAAQYVQGQRFVTEVVEAVGRDGFNRVWLGSQNLPSAREIRHPQEWVDRVAF